MNIPARALMLGDVVGTPGLVALSGSLKELALRTGADLVVANGENAHEGFGITREDFESLMAAGCHVVTSGNHVWERSGIEVLLDAEPRLLRPANYPPGTPGSGYIRIRSGGFDWIVINAQGREGLYAIDCPFRSCAAIVEQVRRDQPDALIIVDFHAESFEEKEALAWHLDSAVSVVAGTHTHVQTADERILPGGCGYIGDLGMCGSRNSIIGVRTEICLSRSITQMPIKMEAADGPAGISGVLFSMDPVTRRCVDIERISI